MAKNSFKRYIWLVDTIHQAGRITFDEINDKWKNSSFSEGDNLSKKTFHNHKEAIQEVFDIVIGCDTKGGYKYYIENAEDMENGITANWLLNTFTISNLINENQKLKNRIILEDVPSEQQFLMQIIKAMRDGFKIEITYQSYVNSYESTFQINPYFVKLFKQRWYVIAYSEYFDKVMVYALDRIQDLKITQNKFDYPKDFNPEEYFINCFGVINDESIEPCIVRLKVSVHHAKYLRGLPLHRSQEEVESSEEFTIFEYYIKPTLDFMREVLSMGNDAEVLKPEWFREQIEKNKK